MWAFLDVMRCAIIFGPNVSLVVAFWVPVGFGIDYWVCGTIANGISFPLPLCVVAWVDT
jgi:hypothetical protein